MKKINKKKETPSSPDSDTLKVRITPGARKDEILGWSQDRLRLKIASPPVEGKANQALVKFIAKQLGLKRRQVSLVSGEKSREKTLRLKELAPGQLEKVFPQ